MRYKDKDIKFEALKDFIAPFARRDKKPELEDTSKAKFNEQ